MRDDAIPAADRGSLFRPLAIDDLENAVAVAGAAFDEPLTLDGLAALLALPSVFGIAAFDAGHFVGFVLSRVAGGEGEILWLAVEESCRRRGFGGTLLDGALIVAASRGAGRMLLEVAETNLAAQTLYAACGFTPVGRRPGYYRSPNGVRFDGLIFARDL